MIGLPQHDPHYCTQQSHFRPRTGSQESASAPTKRNSALKHSRRCLTIIDSAVRNEKLDQRAAKTEMKLPRRQL